MNSDASRRPTDQTLSSNGLVSPSGFSGGASSRTRRPVLLMFTASRRSCNYDILNGHPPSVDQSALRAVHDGLEVKP